MMFRKVIFWLHFGGALAAGLVILVMCVTGAALAMNGPLTAWAERDVRRIAPHDATATRLSLSEAAAAAARQAPLPGFRQATIARDPDAAIVLTAKDNSTWTVDPYSGAVRKAEAPRLQAVEHAMLLWHVALGDVFGRPAGVTIVGAANWVFLFLICSGLVLWWPRLWTWRTVRPLIWFVRSARGRTRDWNWHTTVAIWSLPVLAVLVGTGVVMASPPVNRLIYRLAGQPLGANGRPATVAMPTTAGRTETRISRALDVDGFVGELQRLHPRWTEMDVSLGKGGGAVDIRSADAWPPFNSVNARWNAQSGTISERDSFASFGPGVRVRRWIRLLHSGDAFLAVGRAVAAVGCLAGCLLVWTGYSMAFRRLRKRSG